jgi:hypothetical protein
LVKTIGVALSARFNGLKTRLGKNAFVIVNRFLPVVVASNGVSFHN